jgi:phosphate uptake regulator
VKAERKSKMEKNIAPLAQQVYAILKDSVNYYTEIDYCHPERISEDDLAEIELSAVQFRDSITPEQVAEETEEWQDQFSAMPAEEQALLIACHIMDSNADHGIYNTISVYLTPKNK